MKIPGLNAPLPPGASFGNHAGGWGRPPVDQFGRPLYGDVFGQSETSKVEAKFVYAGDGTVIPKKHWGGRPEPGDDDYESSSSESESEDEDSDDEDDSDTEELLEEGEKKSGTESVASTASGFSSMASNVQVRKQEDGGDETPQLYTVLKEKERKAGSGEVFGSAHTYVLGEGGDGDAAAAGEGGAESVISKAAGKKKSKRKRGGDDSDDSDDEDAAKRFKF